MKYFRSISGRCGLQRTLEFVIGPGIKIAQRIITTQWKGGRGSLSIFCSSGLSILETSSLVSGLAVFLTGMMFAFLPLRDNGLVRDYR
jgi:hypothetical protein